MAHRTLHGLASAHLPGTYLFPITSCFHPMPSVIFKPLSSSRKPCMHLQLLHRAPLVFFLLGHLLSCSLGAPERPTFPARRLLLPAPFLLLPTPSSTNHLPRLILQQERPRGAAWRRSSVQSLPVPSPQASLTETSCSVVSPPMTCFILPSRDFPSIYPSTPFQPSHPL